MVHWQTYRQRPAHIKLKKEFLKDTVKPMSRRWLEAAVPSRGWDAAGKEQLPLPSFPCSYLTVRGRCDCIIPQEDRSRCFRSKNSCIIRDVFLLSPACLQLFLLPIQSHSSILLASVPLPHTKCFSSLHFRRTFICSSGNTGSSLTS